MSLPYYKRFPRDFLDGTIGLSLEEKGAYGIVLDLIYMRDGKLEDNAQYIAGQLGCSVRKWLTIREKLFSLGKIECELGFISNIRADKLMVEARIYQEKQAENGKKPKENKPVKKPALKPECKPEPNQSESDKGESSLDKSKHTLSGERESEGFSDFVKAYPQPDGVHAAEEVWNEIVSAGTSPESILSGLKAACRAWKAKHGNDVTWIPKARKWLTDKGWQDHAPAQPDAKPWNGPAEVRKAIVAAIGPDAAKSCFEASEWDGDQIIPRTTWVFDKLRGVPGVKDILAPVRRAA